MMMDTAGVTPLMETDSAHFSVNGDSFCLHILAQVYGSQDGHGQ